MMMAVSVRTADDVNCFYDNICYNNNNFDVCMMYD